MTQKTTKANNKIPQKTVTEVEVELSKIKDKLTYVIEMLEKIKNTPEIKETVKKPEEFLFTSLIKKV